MFFYIEPGESTHVFPGNTDRNTVVRHALPAPYHSFYVRMYDVSCHNACSVRWELYGYRSTIG